MNKRFLEALSLAVPLTLYSLLLVVFKHIYAASVIWFLNSADVIGMSDSKGFLN